MNTAPADATDPDSDVFNGFSMIDAGTKTVASRLHTNWKALMATRPNLQELARRPISLLASTLFVALRANEQNASGAASTITTIDLLQSTETTVLDFFRETTRILQNAFKEPWFVNVFASPDALEQFQREFKQMEANFIITNILHQKFQKVAGSMFIENQESQTQMAPILKAAWALFLYFREEFKCFDLIRGFYLLVACLYHVICAVPERIAPSFPIRTKLGSSIDHSQRSNILEALGTMQNYNASQRADQNRIVEDLVRRIDAFVEDGSLQGNKCEGHAIFCPGHLVKNTEVLIKLVRNKQRPRDIDGFMVIEHPNMIGEVAKPSDGHRPESSPTKRVANSAVSPVRTAVAAVPSKSPVTQRQNAMFRTPERPAGVMRPLAPPMTPITAALHENAWISGYVASETTEPDDVLRRFFGACPSNPELEIMSRADGCAERLKDRVSGDILIVGKKLYLKSLRRILLKEEQRLQISNFSNLLHDDVMHKALLAICHEIVLQTHLGSKNAGDLTFLLTAFGINDFEFLLMTENFLRDFEVELPSDIRRHTLQLLHKIVDQDAWNCQPLLDLLERTSISAYFTSVIESLQPIGAGMGSHHAGDAGVLYGHRSVAESPLIVRAPRLPRLPQVEPAVPQTEAPGSQSTGDRETERQVHKQVLAFGRRLWQRISDVTITLYKALKQSAGMTRLSLDRSLRVIKTITTTPAMRELLRRRHLHQVIMCVVFGSCKAEKDNEVTFKKIIQEHKFNFDANDELYWNVLLGPNYEQTGNIIEFYNTRFIPICKQVLLDDSDNENQTDPALSPVRRPAMIPASPTTPKRYARNVTVSPYRHERCQFEMTPRTSRLLAVEQDSITQVDARNTAGDSVLRKRTRDDFSGCESFPRENIMQFLRAQLHQADQSQPESATSGGTGTIAVQPAETDPAEADTRPSGTVEDSRVPTLVNKGV